MTLHRSYFVSVSFYAENMGHDWRRVKMRVVKPGGYHFWLGEKWKGKGTKDIALEFGPRDSCESQLSISCSDHDPTPTNSAHLLILIPYRRTRPRRQRPQGRQLLLRRRPRLGRGVTGAFNPTQLLPNRAVRDRDWIWSGWVRACA